jgi:hypothetical protein
VEEMRNPETKHIVSLSLVRDKTSRIKRTALAIEVERREMSTPFDDLNFKWSVPILRRRHA